MAITSSIQNRPWFSIKLSNDRSRESFTLGMAEYLGEDEIRNLVISASSTDTYT